MKYCKQCGNQIEDGAMFCSFCGAPQGAPQSHMEPQPQIAPEYQATYQPETDKKVKKKSKFPKILFIIIPIVVILLVLTLIPLIVRGMRGAKDYRTAISDYYTAVEKDSPQKVAAAMMPAKMEVAISDYLEQEGKYNNVYEAIQEDVDRKYGDKSKVEFKNVNISYKERLDEPEIKEMNEELTSDLNIDIEIEDAYRLDVEYKVKGKSEKKNLWYEGENTFVVYQVKGKWYAIPTTIGF